MPSSLTSSKERSRRRAEPRPQTVALIGTYVPRRCGIATFTADLASALTTAGDTRVRVVAVNDRAAGYPYPEEVAFEIEQNRLQDYRLAADFLNAAGVDVVCLQHEFGIFGGRDGVNVLGLVDHLRMPIVTAIHAIPMEPTASQRDILHGLANVSDRLVTLSATGRRLMIEDFDVAAGRVDVIPHGIPDLPFIDPNFHKDRFGVEGKKVVLTFGLLSPGKGIEHMIQAMPAILERHPDTVYIVLGATHPNVRRSAGESYRLSLQRLARDLQVDDQVVFHDRFVDPDTLSQYIGAADVYVTPYAHEDQIVSGTLTYAMGAGKAVVSTPYRHAREMLSDGRGRLVPFADPDGLAEAIVGMLDDDTERAEARKRAYTFTREMTWDRVAASYLELFRTVTRERRRRPRLASQRPAASARAVALPDVNLDHLKRMTDDTGVLQHAKYIVPDRRHGYCTDDNARGLIVVMLARSFVTDDPGIDDLVIRYLSFVGHALGPNGFRNFLSYERRWTEDAGSADCQGRAIWALGVTAAQAEDERLRQLAATLFSNALPVLEPINHLRPIAFALFGLDAYLGRFTGDSDAKRMRQLLADRLAEVWVHAAREDWPWPEDALTWGNASLPHALLLAGAALERADLVEAALASLRWLLGVQTIDARFAPIGNEGWYRGGGPKARFDQQPIEADVTVAACAAAFEATGDPYWLDEAMLALRWFLGDNDLGLPLYDPRTGGCSDGLGPHGTNENQGAESTLAWLSALLRSHELQIAGAFGWTRDGQALPAALVARRPTGDASAAVGRSHRAS
jgi:glycosyltransferase involved in cell wall biosynthesis